MDTFETIDIRLPEKVEKILIPVTVYNENYKIPACLITDPDTDKKKYRITHKTLIHAFRLLRQRHRGLHMESGVIDGSFIGTASVGYCFTGCRISNGDDHNDTFFGEVKVVSSLPEAARFNPFTVAVNRAQDKAILDFLDLESQVFYEDGSPALYNDPTDAAIDDRIVEEPVNSENETPLPDGLNDAEQAEFDSLSKQKMGLTIAGEQKMYEVCTIPESTLNFIASDKNTFNEAYKDIASRYIKLRAKKAARDQAVLDKKKTP